MSIAEDRRSVVEQRAQRAYRDPPRRDYGAEMTSKQTPPWFQPEMSAYVGARAAQPDPVLSGLIERTRAETGGAATMQVSASQGALLTLLTRVTGARRALELGTFTGYSSICIARGLADGGSLLCCDVSEEYTAIAREAWAEAGLTDRIELRIAPALDTLEGLAGDGAVRPGLHRRRQAELPALLRGASSSCCEPAGC